MTEGAQEQLIKKCSLQIVHHHFAVLNVPNEVQIGQNVNHRSIARFRSSTDRNFRPVISRLIEFHRDIGESEMLLHECLEEISIEIPSTEGKSLGNCFSTRSKCL